MFLSNLSVKEAQSY